MPIRGRQKKLDEFRVRAKRMRDGSDVHRIYQLFDSLERFSAAAEAAIGNLVRYLEPSAYPSELSASAQRVQPKPKGLLLGELNDLRSRVETKAAGVESTPHSDVAVHYDWPGSDDATFDPRTTFPSSPSSINEILPPDNNSQAEMRDTLPTTGPDTFSRRRGGWLLLIGSATALTTIWFFPREFAHFAMALITKITYVATSLIELVRSAAAPPPAWRGRTVSADIVDASAFSPEACAPGETVLVQIFFHRRSQASAAKKRAQESDHQATRRSFCTFEAAVNRGQRLGVKLESQHFLIDEPEQSIVWRGEPCMCQFSVTLPRAVTSRSCQITANFYLDGVPVGVLKFSLALTPTMSGSLGRAGLRGDSSRHFEYAFLSYSSRDRREVLQCAQVLEGVGIDFFLDAVSLRSGEIWERRLYEEIDRSDVFMLFWSKNVEQTESKWIEREVTYALNRQEASEDQLPCFRPTFLGGDKPNRPPWLPAHIQFDNALRRHLLAVRHDRGGY
jgi:TIR domain